MLIDTNGFKEKLTVAFCKILKRLLRCNTKDKMDIINFGEFWIRFMIDMADIMVSNETGDKTVQETILFVIIDSVYHCQKLDSNIIDYPCTPTIIQKQKINENVRYFKKMVILHKFKSKHDYNGWYYYIIIILIKINRFCNMEHAIIMEFYNLPKRILVIMLCVCKKRKLR